MKLSIVIPCYNEERTIREVITRVLETDLPAGWTREVLVVNDGSKDRTAEVLQHLPANPQLVILNHPQNRGKGAALKTAFAKSTGDFVLIQDADFEYAIEDYSALLEPIIQNRAQIVFGSRTLGKNNVPYTFVYYWGGVMTTKLFNFLFGTSLSDIATCYKVFPARVIPELLKGPHDDFVYDAFDLTITLVRAGKVVEVPIHYTARSAGEGKKLNWRHGLRVLKTMISYRLWQKQP